MRRVIFSAGRFMRLYNDVIIIRYGVTFYCMLAVARDFSCGTIFVPTGKGKILANSREINCDIVLA